MSAGDAAEQVRRQVQDGVAKAQREFQAAKAQAQDVQRRADAAPPAEDADQALEQTRLLRSRIDRDLRALEARIPPTDTVMGQLQAVGGAVVGSLALVGVITTILSQRKEKKRFEAEADRMAMAVARHLPAAMARVSPPVSPQPTGSETGGKGRTLFVLSLLAGAAYAAWSQLRDRGADPDLWGPPPAQMKPTATPADSEPPPAPSV